MACKMPRSLKLLGRTFRLVLDHKGKLGPSTIGYYEPLPGIITLEPAMIPDQLKATALHEVIHDLDENAGTKLGERGVTVLGAMLFSVMRDNPRFVAWLMEKE